MNLLPYLPSTQFGVVAGALVVSGALVGGAQYITHKPASPSLAAVETPTEEWRSALEDVQASAGISLPEPPDPETVAALLEGARSTNLTQTIARTLFINLSNAKAQGLGDDIPTQDDLITKALAEAQKAPAPALYTRADLTLVPANKESLHAYGNATIAAILANPRANAPEALEAFGKAVDSGSPQDLAPLKVAHTEYVALAEALVEVDVPETLAPLHVQVLNSVVVMAGALKDMHDVAKDPLRGLAGLQKFQTSGGEALRVLTTLADTLQRSGILFSKDEPGDAWSVFRTSP